MSTVADQIPPTSAPEASTDAPTLAESGTSALKAGMDFITTGISNLVPKAEEEPIQY